jgi:predicted phage-related endonuclease
MAYHVIEHEQGSAAWLHWRHGGIGASDAPALMGVGHGTMDIDED